MIILQLNRPDTSSITCMLTVPFEGGKEDCGEGDYSV